jgi:hypothetical protein
MGDYTNIRSQFIKDRLRETKWEDRKYIDALLFLEQILRKGGPSGFAGAMAFRCLSDHYPVELRALRLEISEGKSIDSEVLTAIREEYAMELTRRDEERNRSRHEQEDDMKREYQRWLELGGQP